MTKAPDLREIFDPPEEIIKAALDGNLVLFVGAGVSIQLGLPSWGELAKDAIDDLRIAGHLNFAEVEQLMSLDARKQLSIAQSIAEENSIPLDITKRLRVTEEGESIYKHINDIGCTCVTTNYDTLLKPRFINPDDSSSTAAPVNRYDEVNDLLPRYLNQPGTVMHLHGSIEKTETMIVSTKQYLNHYEHPNVSTFLGELFELKTVLFLGYSLEEAEILEHILRKGSASGAEHERKRFVLMPFYSNQATLYQHLHTYYEKSFSVHLLGCMRDYQDYKCLEALIGNWVHQIEVRKPRLDTDYEFMTKVFDEQ